MKNTLIINGHEKFPLAKGELNKSFVSEAQNTLINIGHNVKLIEIDITYDLDQVVKDIFWADNIIYQTPVYWFNLPGAFKKFIDSVFNHGLLQFINMDSNTEYGSAGLLTEKKYMLSTTWNAPKSTFNNKNGYLLKDGTIDDVFLPFHLSNKYIGMSKLPSFATYDIYHNPTIEADLKNFKNHLKTYLK